MWNSLGAQPLSDEAEVTVIGPGFGESLVIHLGDQQWMIVDSCVDVADSRKPSAPLKYLYSIGVNPQSAVKYVVISHWDDDHVRGIADVVDKCGTARVVIAPAFAERKFLSFVKAISKRSAATEGGNVTNIRRVLELLASRRASPIWAAPGRTIISLPLVRSWSPTDTDISEFLEYVATNHPKAGEPTRKAIPPSSNIASIVLTIDWSDCTVLLAADMERHADPSRGWGGVISEALRIGVRKSNLVKIPHHGSNNGHHDGMWKSLLIKEPISVVAPYGRGHMASRPPTSGDIKRISDLSGAT